MSGLVLQHHLLVGEEDVLVELLELVKLLQGSNGDRYEVHQNAPDHVKLDKRLVGVVDLLQLILIIGVNHSDDENQGVGGDQDQHLEELDGHLVGEEYRDDASR